MIIWFIYYGLYMVYIIIIYNIYNIYIYIYIISPRQEAEQLMYC